MTPNQSHNAWTIEPPPGIRFVNQLGGEVTVYFPRGSEKAVHDHIIKAVHAAYLASLGQAAPPIVLPAPPPPAPSHGGGLPGVQHGAAVTQVVKMPDGSESVITYHAPPPAMAQATTIGGTLAAAPIDAPAPAQTIEEADAEIAEIVGDDAAPLPPVGDGKRCTHRLALSPEFEVQCSLTPHTAGMHAVEHGGVFYPLPQAPRETWAPRT